MNRRLISILLAGLFVLYCGSANAGSFTDGTGTAVGTVTDNTTGLMWQKQNDLTLRTWENAISYCEGLSLGGFTDWRLPNVKELSSLVDDSRYNPSIDPLFTSTLSSNYWSSTTCAGLTPYAWYVNFYYGDTNNYSKAYTYYVRCVRGQ